MSRNLPPGVTGREYAIAGPDSEFEDRRLVACQNDDCDAFEIEVEQDVLGETYRGEWTVWWTCPVCDVENSDHGQVDPF